MADSTHGTVGASDDIRVITPDDDNDLPFLARLLLTDGTGDLVIHNAKGVSVTIDMTNKAGRLEGKVRRVLATGTDASHTNIVIYE